MIYFYVLLTLTALLTIGALLLSVLANRKPPEQSVYYQLAAILAIFLVACIVPLPISISYKAAVILGILLLLVGSTLHRLLRLPMAVAETFVLMIILLYTAAFASLHPLKWPTPWLLVLLLIGSICYWGVRPKLVELNGTTAAYTIALLLMVWQATEVLITQPALWSGLAFGGALLFAILKLLQIIDHVYRAEAPIYTVDILQRRVAPLPAWLQRWQSKGRVQQRLWYWLQVIGQRGQAYSSRLIEQLRLPAIAHKSTQLLTPLMLLSYWLVALSVWGPSLLNLILGRSLP